MKKLLLMAAVALAAAAVCAGVARAGVSVHAAGKTYVPAPNVPRFAAFDGFVPEVNLPTSVPYYASKPPHGVFAEVYATRLAHVVWVPLAEASSHGWYVSHGGSRLSGSDVALIAIAAGLVALLILLRRRAAGSG